MKRLLLAAVAATALAAPASAGVLGIDIFDNSTLIDSISGVIAGTANLVTSDASFSNITVSVQGSPILPFADLSSVTLDATTSGAFTGGTHILDIQIFQTGVNGTGPTQSTFTINGLINGPGPTTESTFEGGTASNLGTLLATHTFPLGDVNDHFGPVTAGTGAFTADAQEYNVAFSAANQSFGGSMQLTTNVPEASTWVMLISGFGLMALAGAFKAKSARLAA